MHSDTLQYRLAGLSVLYHQQLSPDQTCRGICAPVLCDALDQEVDTAQRTTIYVNLGEHLTS